MGKSSESQSSPTSGFLRFVLRLGGSASTSTSVVGSANRLVLDLGMGPRSSPSFPGSCWRRVGLEVVPREEEGPAAAAAAAAAAGSSADKGRSSLAVRFELRVFGIACLSPRVP